MGPILCKTNLIFVDNNVHMYQAFLNKTTIWPINLLHLVIIRNNCYLHTLMTQNAMNHILFCTIFHPGLNVLNREHK